MNGADGIERRCEVIGTQDPCPRTSSR